MQKLVYYISPEEKNRELEWLREQMIFPTMVDSYDWINQKWFVKVGVIVGKEAALSIKLKHKLELQTDYKQK